MGVQQRASAAGDFDGDGAMDLAFAAGSGLEVLFGRGDGTFLSPLTLSLSTSPVDVAVEDLDGDGFPDLVAACGSPEVAVLLSDGDGTFGSARYFPTAELPSAMALADFNGDANIDVALLTAQGLRLVPGNGDGTFGPPAFHVGYRWGTELVAGDVNGDGASDLLLASMAYQWVEVKPGDGNGGFWPSIGFYMPDLVYGLGAGDLNGDGYDDVVGGVDYQNVAVALSTGTGSFQITGTYPGADSQVSVVDLDADGTADVVASGYEFSTSGMVVVYRGNGDGTLQTVEVHRIGASIQDHVFADVDSNGSLDVIGADTSADAVVLLSSALGITPPVLPDGYLGYPYAAQLVPSGGTPAYTFQLASGSLPAGLSLSSSGAISGTPTAFGPFTFTARLRDSAGCFTDRTYDLVVNGPCGRFQVYPPTLPYGTQGVAYGATFSASGGTPPYAFGLFSGTLPPGLSLSSAGALAGTPQAVGTWSFQVSVADSAYCYSDRPYSVTVIPPPLAVDHLVGAGAGLPNGNRVAVLDASGTPTAVAFDAYAAGSWGARVGDGDIAAEGLDQILTGPGPGPVLGPHVRGFRRDGTPMGKVSFYAYGTLRYGVNPAAGEVDDDGFDEIVTGAGPGAMFGPHVRGFDFDGVSVAPIAGLNFFAYATVGYGVHLETGRLDGAPRSRILTGAGPSPAFGPDVRGFAFASGAVSPLPGLAFQPFATRYGAVVAAGDVDADGRTEMIVATGPGPANTASFAGFGYASGSVSGLPGFQMVVFPGRYFGARIGTGDLTLDGRDDTVCGPGPDPAATAMVLAFTYGSGSLSGLGPGFVALPTLYGVDVEAALLDQ